MDHILRARALLDPLANGGPTADIVLPEAIDRTEVPAKGETHPLHLEIFGDKTGDRMYKPRGRRSRLEGPAARERAPRLSAQLNSNFVRLTPRPQSIGGDFHIKLSGMNVQIGQMLEVMVIEDATQRFTELTYQRPFHE